MLNWIRNWFNGITQNKYFPDGEYAIFKPGKSLNYNIRHVTIKNGFIVRDQQETTSNVIASIFNKYNRGFCSPVDKSPDIYFNLELKDDGTTTVAELLDNNSLHKIRKAQ